MFLNSSNPQTQQLRKCPRFKLPHKHPVMLFVSTNHVTHIHFLCAFISFANAALSHLVYSTRCETCNTQPLKAQALILFGSPTPTQKAAQLSQLLKVQCPALINSTASCLCRDTLQSHVVLFLQRPFALLAATFVSRRWLWTPRG